MTETERLRNIRMIPVSEPEGGGDVGFVERAEGDPDGKMTVVANVVTVMWAFKKGQVGHGHTHAHDHQSLLTSGSVFCIVDGAVHEYSAPAIIIVRKDKTHQFIAKEDNTILFCVHALRKGEGVDDVIDEDENTDMVFPISNGEPK